MSEKHNNHEHGKQHEQLVDHEHAANLHKHTKEKADKAAQEKAGENLAQIQELARTEAQESHTITKEQETPPDADSLLGMQQSLKNVSYARTLAKTRQKLPKVARSFSKIVHNDVIDSVSNVSAQTVARPSGILGGSISAFLGSVLILYYSKHYGFKYNYLLLFVLFIGGYLVGASLELVLWFFRGRKQRY